MKRHIAVDHEHFWALCSIQMEPDNSKHITDSQSEPVNTLFKEMKLMCLANFIFKYSQYGQSEFVALLCLKVKYIFNINVI